MEKRLKSHPVPKVGDTVVLNNFGLEQLFGSPLALQHMKTLRLKVTQVDAESMTSPELTFPLEVDDVEINRLMIDHWCFDIVEHYDANNEAMYKEYLAVMRKNLPREAAITPEMWNQMTTVGREGFVRLLFARIQDGPTVTTAERFEANRSAGTW